MSTFYLFAFGIPAAGILLAIVVSRLLGRRHSGKTVVLTRSDGTVVDEEASNPKERTDQHPEDEAEERWEGRTQQEWDVREFDERNRWWREEQRHEQADRLRERREDEYRHRREQEAAHHEPKDDVQPQSIDRLIKEMQEKLDRFSRKREGTQAGASHRCFTTVRA